MVKKKKVVMLTTSFPYGTGENFIEPEIGALPSDIDLEIVPCQPSKKSVCRELPENVVVNNLCSISANGFTRIWYMLRGLFSKSFLTECKKIKASPKSLTMIAGYLGRSIEIYEKLKKYYAKEIRDSEITFYSYWLLEGAHAISILKSKYGDSISAVSRAHGVDVYDGRSVYGVVPGRSYALSHLDRVYVCSKQGVQYLADKNLKFRSKFVCGYLGTRDFSFAEYGNSSEFVVASCARLVELKRVHLLANALALITDVKIRWVHMGDGPERSNVEKAIEQLPDNVIVDLKGNTKHSDVMKFYQTNKVNLFVNTSTTEGLPVSAMEAISFGVPVIATNVGGTSEVVNEHTGVLIPSDFDIIELAEKIKNYITMDNVEYMRARREARAFWEDTFSASKNYMEFYKEITEE